MRISLCAAAVARSFLQLSAVAAGAAGAITRARPPQLQPWRAKENVSRVPMTR
ncbi:twin-arginine translocation signal domain-containing protein [Paraburkholderia sp. J7]|uniref:twin-arginine translocation signal domain-containing protein n=1 Tax=Paraburkholderia sp. J7 TaxID=2805438 RepID=UPI0039F00D82